MPDQRLTWSDVAADFADISSDDPLNMDDPSIKLSRAEIALNAAHRGMTDLTQQLDEAHERIAQLTRALAPFAHYDDENDFTDASDQEIAVEFGITEITFGDFRQAKATLARTIPDDTETKPNPADLRAKIRTLGREAAEKHREALDMLKECEGQIEQPKG